MYLINILNLKDLGLVIGQVQDSVSLTNMSDPKNLGSAVS
jgi:hypothetical protein